MKLTKTCKIQILPNEDFNGTYKYVKGLMGKLASLSNEICRRHYFSLYEMKEMKEGEQKLSALKASEMMKLKYGYSVQNIGYDLTKKYPEIPSSVRTCLNSNIYKTLNEMKNKIFNCQMSLPTFTKDQMPIPFQYDNNIRVGEKNYYFHFFDKKVFKIHFGRDRSNVRSIVDKVLSGEYKPLMSNVIYKKNKLFLYLTYQFDKNEIVELDKTKVLGIDLGINRPMSLGRNDEQYVPQINIGGKIQHTRMSIYKHRRSLQGQLKYASGGRGRKNKMQKLEDLRAVEKNFCKTMNDELSRAAINYCLKEGIGTIHIEDLTNITKDSTNYFLKSWAFYQLQQMIIYKANEFGIDVLYVNPKYTSQTCCKCGNQNSEQRDGVKFICLNSECDNFEIEKDADINAAINISRREGYPEKTRKKIQNKLENSIS